MRLTELFSAQDAPTLPVVPRPIQSLYLDVLPGTQLMYSREFFHAIEVVERMGKVPRIEWNRDEIGQRRLALYADDPTTTERPTAPGVTGRVVGGTTTRDHD